MKKALAKVKAMFVKAADGVKFPGLLVEDLIHGYDAVQKAKAKLDNAKAIYEPVEQKVREIVAAAKYPVSEGFEFPYEDRVIKIGKQRQETTVTAAPEDIVLILEGIEKGLSFKLMRFKLEDLRAYMTPEQLARVVQSVDSGKRAITVE